MKKIVALAIALVLCLTSVAFAASSPTSSKVTESLTYVDTYVEFLGVHGLNMKLDAKAKIVKEELKKLAATSAADYFAGAVTVDGEEADLAAMLEKEDYEVYELVSVTLKGYSEKLGKVNCVLNFPSAFEKGAKLAVMIGSVTEDGIAWTALEAEGANGGVAVTLEPETAMAIQNGETLLAVVG